MCLNRSMSMTRTAVDVSCRSARLSSRWASCRHAAAFSSSVLASTVAACTRSRSNAWYCNRNTAGNTMTANHGTRTSDTAVTAPSANVANSIALSDSEPNSVDGSERPWLSRMTDETSSMLTALYTTTARTRVTAPPMVENALGRGSVSGSAVAPATLNITTAAVYVTRCGLIPSTARQDRTHKCAYTSTTRPTARPPGSTTAPANTHTEIMSICDESSLAKSRRRCSTCRETSR